MGISPEKLSSRVAPVERSTEVFGLRLLGVERARVPAVTLVGPVKALDPERVQVPVPDLVRAVTALALRSWGLVMGPAISPVPAVSPWRMRVLWAP